MTFIISATVCAAFVYFAIAFIATMRDRLMSRFDNNCFQKPEPDIAVTDCEDIPQIVAEPEIEDATVICYDKSIRGLRDYIRSNNLQAVVKERIGKTVSKCSKDELMAAIA